MIRLDMFWLTGPAEKGLFCWYFDLSGKRPEYGSYMYAQPTDLGPDKPWGYIDIEDEYAELALLKFPFLRVKE